MRPATKTSRLPILPKLNQPARRSSVLLLFLFALMGNGLLAALRHEAVILFSTNASEQVHPGQISDLADG
jgi:hypothetical protein